MNDNRLMPISTGNIIAFYPPAKAGGNLIK